MLTNYQIGQIPLQPIIEELFLLLSLTGSKEKEKIDNYLPS